MLEDGLFVGENAGGQEFEAFLTRQGFSSTAIRVKWNRAVLLLQQVDIFDAVHLGSRNGAGKCVETMFARTALTVESQIFTTRARRSGHTFAEVLAPAVTLNTGGLSRLQLDRLGRLRLLPQPV